MEGERVLAGSVKVVSLLHGNCVWKQGAAHLICTDRRWRLAVRLSFQKADRYVWELKSGTKIIYKTKGVQRPTLLLNFPPGGETLRMTDFNVMEANRLVDTINLILEKKMPIEEKKPWQDAENVPQGSPLRAVQKPPQQPAATRIPLSPKQPFSSKTQGKYSDPSLNPSNSSARMNMKFLDRGVSKSAEKASPFRNNTSSFYSKSQGQENQRYGAFGVTHYGPGEEQAAGHRDQNWRTHSWAAPGDWGAHRAAAGGPRRQHDWGRSDHNVATRERDTGTTTGDRSAWDHNSPPGAKDCRHGDSVDRRDSGDRRHDNWDENRHVADGSGWWDETELGQCVEVAQDDPAAVTEVETGPAVEAATQEEREHNSWWDQKVEEEPLDDDVDDYLDSMVDGYYDDVDSGTDGGYQDSRHDDRGCRRREGTEEDYRSDSRESYHESRESYNDSRGESYHSRSPHPYSRPTSPYADRTKPTRHEKMAAERQEEEINILRNISKFVTALEKVPRATPTPPPPPEVPVQDPDSRFGDFVAGRLRGLVPGRSKILTMQLITNILFNADLQDADAATAGNQSDTAATDTAAQKGADAPARDLTQTGRATNAAAENRVAATATQNVVASSVAGVAVRQ